MKKFSVIIIAMALVLGLGQCKKQEKPTTTDTEGKKVYITVNAGHDGTKHEIYPNTGAYVFTNGDLLYVGNNGHFIGTLEYQDGAFSGGIYEPSTTDYLHFYFLGGKGPQAPEAGTESFTVSIADQSDNLPVLSYAPSTQKYTDGNATYTTILRNKCALVKFTTNEIPAETAVSISGMKNEATINFNDNTIAPTDTTGAITLHAESTTSRWAILLPGEEVTTIATAEGYNSTDVTVPAVANNGYLAGESAVNFEMTEAIILVESITLNKTATTLLPGNTETLSVASVTPDNANDQTVTWSSNKTSVATVNSTTGEVTAVAPGTATITATANDGSGVTATCAVTVTLPYPIALNAVTSDYVGSVVTTDRNVYATAANATAAGKTAVAIIAYVGSAGSVDASNATYKGLAIAMSDANGGNTCIWANLNQGFAFCLNNNTEFDINIALGFKDGITCTNTLVNSSHSSHSHAAAIAAKSNNGTAAPTGTSGWFMPSLGQWNLIVQGLATKKAGSPVTTNLSYSNSNNYYKSSYLNSIITSAGGTGFKANNYWSTTEMFMPGVWVMYFGDGYATEEVKNHNWYLRSVLAF